MANVADTASQTNALSLWQSNVLWIGKLVFTVLLAVQLAYMVWAVVAPKPLILKAPSRAGGEVTRVQGITGTHQYHLFGIAKDEPVKVVKKDVSAPVTRLRLSLLGVNKASVETESSAIIAPKNGKGDFYRIGETVQGRTKLSAVFNDKVILDTNGKLETLKFDEGKKTGIEAKSVAPKRETRRARGSLKKRLGKVRSASEFMDLANEELASDARGALRELGLEAVGSGEGYRVTAGSVLTSLKLRPGDIVLSVNGQRLGNIDDDQTLLEQVSTSGNARIEVQRGDNRFVVNHRLN